MAKESLDLARHRRNRYAIEIQKKFSLAAACIVLVLSARRWRFGSRAAVWDS